MIAWLKSYLIGILIGLDQLAVTLLNGYPDETLSSWAYRMHVKDKWFGWTYYAINWAFFWQSDHCRDAYESERLRQQLPPLLR